MCLGGRIERDVIHDTRVGDRVAAYCERRSERVRADLHTPRVHLFRDPYTATFDRAGESNGDQSVDNGRATLPAGATVSP